MAGSNHRLSPLEAAEAAQAVYSIRRSGDVVTGFKNTRIKDSFTLSNDSRFTGKSGIFQSESGFGVIGTGGDSRKNEAIIVTRGTQTGADWFSYAFVRWVLDSLAAAMHQTATMAVGLIHRNL